MTEQFKIRKTVDERTIVNPGSAVRGYIIRGERPTEILVRFTKSNISAIFRNDSTKQKFEDWLCKAVYPAFKN